MSDGVASHALLFSFRYFGLPESSFMRLTLDENLHLQPGSKAKIACPLICKRNYLGVRVSSSRPLRRSNMPCLVHALTSNGARRQPSGRDLLMWSERLDPHGPTNFLLLRGHQETYMSVRNASLHVSALSRQLGMQTQPQAAQGMWINSSSRGYSSLFWLRDTGSSMLAFISRAKKLSLCRRYPYAAV